MGGEREKIQIIEHRATVSGNSFLGLPGFDVNKSWKYYLSYQGGIKTRI